MKSIIFALLIGCGKKAETTTSNTENETEQNETVTTGTTQIISVSNPGLKTNSDVIETKDVVTEDKTETEDASESSTETTDETSEEKTED